MSPRDKLIKEFNSICRSLGMNPILLTFLLALITGIYITKDIKIWNAISPFRKNMDIAIWFAVFMFLLVYLVKLIKGD